MMSQPEFNEMLDRADLRQLRQRIVLSHHLEPFDAADMNSYIDERLRLAGYTGKGIFDRAARRELFAVTGGVPRLLNVVCDGALLTGYGRELATISADIIREVAGDLRLRWGPSDCTEDLEPGSHARRRGWLGLFR